MTAAAARTDDPGFVLGRYEVHGRLGDGGMGTVYRGHDPVLDRTVAIKTIQLAMPKEDLPDYEARFYQEARAAGGLAHPNIVVIYDIGKTEKLAYMVMEYVHGRELRDMLARDAPLHPRDTVRICADVADALAYAHRCGVIHRDIKPTNIMVTDDGHVKSTDFGIARMRSSELKTMTGVVLGSPRYMSPEQVTGAALDSRTDVFSLGVVLYEMLTGRPPFQADSVQGIMFQALNSKPVPPSRVTAGLPRILDFVVAKAIAKDPDHRYPTADAFAADLRACLAELPVRQTSGEATEPRTTIPDHARDHASLSNAFDSSTATLRLRQLVASAPANGPARATPDAQWMAMPPARPQEGTQSPNRQSAGSLRRPVIWLWTISLLAAAVAAYLVIA